MIQFAKIPFAAWGAVAIDCHDATTTTCLGEICTTTNVGQTCWASAYAYSLLVDELVVVSGLVNASGS